MLASAPLYEGGQGDVLKKNKRIPPVSPSSRLALGNPKRSEPRRKGGLTPLKKGGTKKIKRF
ncbi:hypothetical protein ACFL23_04480 [Patescibacteria group bacterium]